MIAAFFAVPILIKGLGQDRFGILTLVWVIVGYFSLFDMGLGRALTKLVAEKIGKGEQKEIPSLIFSALALMGGLSVVGILFLVLFTPWLVKSILNIPVFLKGESQYVFYLLAFSIPIVIMTTCLRGVLEAYQRFDIINAICIPMGFFTYLGPLSVLPFSKNLVMVASVLITGRIIAWICYLTCCVRIIPELRKNLRIRKYMIKPLLNFGGWITVSNIIGPALLYSDRFFIANMISVTAVAYYTTPYEVIIKILVIPTSILGVMFPAFSSILTNNTTNAKKLYKQTIKYMAIIIFPIVFLIYIFSEQGLTIWIDAEFAHNSFRVAQILAIGVMINSFGHISQSLIQAGGRPDVTAKLHLVELVLYLIYLRYFIHAYGIKGAALAWVVRVSISTCTLVYLANRIFKKNLNGDN